MIFTIPTETLNRAVQQAKTEGSSEVEGGHLEKVVPQIVSQKLVSYVYDKHVIFIYLTQYRSAALRSVHVSSVKYKNI